MSSDSVSRRITFLERRLVILDALSLAAERRLEVIEAVAGADSKRAAISAIAELLSVAKVPARAIVERRIGDLSAEIREAVDRERHAISVELGSPRG